MANNSKPSATVLSEILQGNLAKNPVLAAKQARLLKELNSGTRLVLPIGLTGAVTPTDKR